MYPEGVSELADDSISSIGWKGTNLHIAPRVLVRFDIECELVVMEGAVRRSKEPDRTPHHPTVAGSTHVGKAQPRNPAIGTDHGSFLAFGPHVPHLPPPNTTKKKTR